MNVIISTFLTYLMKTYIFSECHMYKRMSIFLENLFDECPIYTNVHLFGKSLSIWRKPIYFAKTHLLGKYLLI